VVHGGLRVIPGHNGSICKGEFRKGLGRSRDLPNFCIFVRSYIEKKSGPT